MGGYPDYLDQHYGIGDSGAKNDNNVTFSVLSRSFRGS
jgi:hypothetical protein